MKKQANRKRQITFFKIMPCLFSKKFSCTNWKLGQNLLNTEKAGKILNKKGYNMKQYEWEKYTENRPTTN